MTRREFVRGAAGVIALPHLQSHLHVGAGPSQQFAYVASGADSLHVFSMRGDVWTQVQQLPSRAPACVLLSPAQQTLYVANELAVHDGLPRGSVEVFDIDPMGGRLTLSSTIPLSLSATRPRHLTLSPDGKLLAVAAYGGGIYNLFPVAEDGSLGHPGIFKDVGGGSGGTSQDSAHPHTISFDAGGRHMLASDFGSDRLSVFTVEDGRLTRQMLRSTGERSGPGVFVFHPAGSLVYAWHELEKTLACYRYDGASGTVGETIQRLAFPGFFVGALAMHPSGRVLYTNQGVWQIDGERGGLTRVQGLLPGAKQIAVAPDGGSVYILNGAIHRMTADRTTGELQAKTRVAVVNEPRSIAVTTIA